MTSKEENNEYTITYEKFMEMFAPKYEDTMIAEQPKGELCDNLKPLINAVEILNELKAYKEKSEKILTLDSIQVDCRNLTEEQIKEMADVFEKNGFNLALDGITEVHFYLRLAECGDSVNLYRLNDTKTTITYEKFMELFGNKLPPYKKTSLKWNYDTLVGDVIETTDEVSPISSREKELKKTLKYLLKKDIILTPKQYEKLWKKS